MLSPVRPKLGPRLRVRACSLRRPPNKARLGLFVCPPPLLPELLRYVLRAVSLFARWWNPCIWDLPAAFPNAEVRHTTRVNRSVPCADMMAYLHVPGPTSPTLAVHLLQIAARSSLPSDPAEHQP